MRGRVYACGRTYRFDVTEGGFVTKGEGLLRELIHEHPEGVPIRGRRILFDTLLARVAHLRRHVARGAAHLVRRGYVVGAAEGQPKIDETYVADGVEEEVLGLDVAVEDLLRVQVREHGCYLQSHKLDLRHT